MAGSSRALKKPLLGDRSYKTLKQAATLILPAIGTLYFTLAPMWDLPKSEEVVGTIAALNTFLGVVLSLSTMTYNKKYSSTGVEYSGSIVIDDSGEKKVFSLELDDDIEVLESRDEVTFKVDGGSTGPNPIVRP